MSLCIATSSKLYEEEARALRIGVIARGGGLCCSMMAHLHFVGPSCVKPPHSLRVQFSVGRFALIPSHEFTHRDTSL